MFLKIYLIQVAICFSTLPILVYKGMMKDGEGKRKSFIGAIATMIGSFVPVIPFLLLLFRIQLEIRSRHNFRMQLLLHLPLMVSRTTFPL